MRAPVATKQHGCIQSCHVHGMSELPWASLKTCKYLDMLAYLCCGQPLVFNACKNEKTQASPNSCDCATHLGNASHVGSCCFRLTATTRHARTLSFSFFGLLCEVNALTFQPAAVFWLSSFKARSSLWNSLADRSCIKASSWKRIIPIDSSHVHSICPFHTQLNTGSTHLPSTHFQLFRNALRKQTLGTPPRGYAETAGCCSLSKATSLEVEKPNYSGNKKTETNNETCYWYDAGWYVSWNKQQSFSHVHHFQSWQVA